MQVTKGTWCMRKQCVPGSLSILPHENLGMRLAIHMPLSPTKLAGSTMWCLFMAGSSLHS